MGNFYSITSSQAAVRDLARAMRDVAGNVPTLPAIYLGGFCMIPANIADSLSAKRLLLVFQCPDTKCGHESFEPLSRFHGRYFVSCRECGASIDLKAKENRVVIEEAIERCLRADARLQEPD